MSKILNNSELKLFVPACPLLTKSHSSHINKEVNTAIHQTSDESLTVKVGGNPVLGARAGAAVRRSKSLASDHMRFTAARSQGLGILEALHDILSRVARVKGDMAKSPSKKEMVLLNKDLAALVVMFGTLNRMLKKVDALLLKLDAKIEAGMTKIIAKIKVEYQAQEKKMAEKAAKDEVTRKTKEVRTAKVEEARKAKPAAKKAVVNPTKANPSIASKAAGVKEVKAS